jgi:hypothetical protein
VAIRWVVNPIDEVVGEDGRTYRTPRISALGYTHSTVIMAGSWCLSFVRATDFTALDADTACVNLLETDYDDQDALIERTVGDLGWTAAKRQRVLAKIEARGVDTSGYTLNTPLWMILRDLARQLDVNLGDIRDLWVGGPGSQTRLLVPPAPEALADDPADDFTEATTNVALTAHTPTGAGAGTGWTQEEITGVITQRVNFTVDRAEATALEANDRNIYTLQPNPTGAEYDVQMTLATVSTVATSPIFLVARLTDASNYYSAGTYRSADAADKKIFKTVAGVITELASGDSGIANGDVLLFQVRNVTKKFFKGGVEQLSTTDNVLTSPGRVGYGMGSAWAVSGDIGAEWQLDNFSFTEVASAVQDPPDWTIHRTRMRAWS